MEALKGLLLYALSCLINGAVVWFVWNFNEIYKVFNCHEMNFAQAVGIVILAKMISDGVKVVEK